MEGQHSHGPASDPDLKILALAILGILAIVIGPTVVGLLTTILTAIIVGLPCATVTTLAIVWYRHQHPRQMPPLWMHTSPYIQSERQPTDGRPRLEGKALHPWHVGNGEIVWVTDSQLKALTQRQRP